jgi:hypothetical protein
MKTTIEIADGILEQAQGLARREETTLRSLVEQSLRLVLKEKQSKPSEWKWKPLVVEEDGLTAEFRDGGWDRIRACALDG